jgi:TPR repeat protein
MSIQDDIEKAIQEHELYSVAEWLPTDWQQAFNQYMFMAEAGDTKAQFNVGYCFARGDVMDQDFEKAFEWYQKAADKGDPRAYYNLSQMYERGESVIADPIKAKELFNRAIELGDVRPQIRTALTNAKEALIRGDRDKARALFYMKPSLESSPAMSCLKAFTVSRSIILITPAAPNQTENIGNGPIVPVRV